MHTHFNFSKTNCLLIWKGKDKILCFHRQFTRAQSSSGKLIRYVRNLIWGSLKSQKHVLSRCKLAVWLDCTQSIPSPQWLIVGFCSLCDCEKLFALHPGGFILSGKKNTLFSCPFLQITGSWLSLCIRGVTVNDVVSLSFSVYSKHSQWLMTPSQALGSLHSNWLSVYSPSTDLLPPRYLLPSYSLSVSLCECIILSLDAYINRFGGRHSLWAVSALLNFMDEYVWRRKREKHTICPCSVISFILMSVKMVPQRMKLLFSALTCLTNPPLMFIWQRLWALCCASEASLQTPLNKWSTTRSVLTYHIKCFLNVTQILLQNLDY